MSNPSITPAVVQPLILESLAASSSSKLDSRQLRLSTPQGDVSFLDGESLNTLKGVLDSLTSRDMIEVEIVATNSHVLTAEGSGILARGSHEAIFWSALPARGQGEPKTIPQLQAEIGAETVKIGQMRAFKSKWIAKEGAGFVKAVDSIVDTTQNELEEIERTGEHSGGDKVLGELRKRKLVTQR